MKNKEIVLESGTHCILFFLTKNGRVKDSEEGELVKDVSVIKLKRSDVDPWVWSYFLQLFKENNGLAFYLRKSLVSISKDETREERTVIVTNAPPGLKTVQDLERVK